MHEVFPIYDGCISTGSVTHDACVESLGYFLFDAVECTAADEKDVACVHGDHALLRMLPSTLRRDVHDRSFEQFQESLLHTLATHVTRDGRVVALAGDLIDLIDENNASLSGLNVIIGRLQQACQDAFDVFSHIARFSQNGGVDYAEGHVQLACHGTRQQGLARSRGTDHDDVGFLNLHVISSRFLH